MSKEEILKAAIEKAEVNGWREPGRQTQNVTWDQILESGEYYVDIFSHDFAKAFWKDDDEHSEGWELYSREHDISTRGNFAWQYHLQQLALEEDRLKYLEKFLSVKNV